MPSVPIYIRKNDWMLWEMIEDKPAFIHEALMQQERSDALAVKQYVVAEGRELGILPPPRVLTPNLKPTEPPEPLPEPPPDQKIPKRPWSQVGNKQ